MKRVFTFIMSITLSASLAQAAITLQWNSYTWSGAVGTFIMEKSTDGANWTVVSSTIPGNTFTFSDTGSVVVSCYRVKAAAPGYITSNPSNQACIIQLTVPTNLIITNIQ